MFAICICALDTRSDKRIAAGGSDERIAASFSREMRLPSECASVSFVALSLCAGGAVGSERLRLGEQPGARARGAGADAERVDPRERGGRDVT
eukprot:3300506-Pleurochrysis_carterae.AAC.1